MTARSANDFVVATAGHVDHGKSTLVRALTGIEPDRWAEEHRRGLTIDLGFAWTSLRSGRQLSFVDVPGHERFLGNMLAGLGPSPVVCFVVAADAGWQPQSSDHRDAVAALGIEHGLIVLTRIDLLDGDATAVRRRLAAVEDQVRDELAGTGLRDAPLVPVSALHGTGLDTLRVRLDQVLGGLAPAPVDGRVRLWIDRAFTISGAGTVVTGTLAAGTINRGDSLQLCGAYGVRPVQVRSLQRHNSPTSTLLPTTRAAVNLRSVAADTVHRGDVLLSPDTWPTTELIDVRRVSGIALDRIPALLTAHVGTAAVPARLRPFDADLGRLTLDRPLPLILTDRLVLRDPGSRRILAGAQVLDPAPPQLRRRGAGARRRTELAEMPGHGDPAGEVARRKVVRRTELAGWGHAVGAAPPDVVEVGDWWIDPCTWQDWRRRLHDLVVQEDRDDPLSGGPTHGSVISRIGLPTPQLLVPLAAAAGLESTDGRVRLPGAAGRLGPAVAAIAEVERRLAADPFAAPEADDLAGLGLGDRELAAAERAGRLLRLGSGVVLLPTTPALAMRQLAELPQPFTTSQARQALHTTRRVAIPLLEHLDGRGWTRRLDAAHRMISR